MNAEPGTSILEMPTESISYRITPLGIDFQGELNHEEWVQLGHRLGNAGRSIGFLIGDWLNYGNGKGEWGETYTEAMRITGLEYKTLRDYASVSEKVQMSLRNDKLAFEHHKKVAPLKDEADQRKWLKTAEKEATKGKPMSSRRLAKSILLNRVATDSDMTVPENDRGRKSMQVHVLRLTTFWRKLEERDWLQNASLFQIRVHMEDLESIVRIYEALRARAVALESELPPDQETIPPDWDE